MPGITLGAENTAMDKAKFLLWWSLYFSWEAGETYDAQYTCNLFVNITQKYNRDL